MKCFSTILFLLLFLSGSAQWSNTTNDFYDTLHMPVCTSLRDQSNTIVIRSYPDSGYIYIWQDQRITGNGIDVFAQKLDKNGNTLWVTDGVPVVTNTFDQSFRWAQNSDYRNYSRACTDSANGFYIALHDYNAAGNGNRVVVQHIRPNGSMVFPATGYIVAEGTPSTYQYAYPQLIADGRNGFFIGYIRQVFGGADLIVRCMRDENGVMKDYGGGQMDMNGINRQENSPCGIRNVIAEIDAFVSDFYIYPDLQGGCNVVMNLSQNMGGNERTFIGYNRLCRVKKDCQTTVLRRTSDIATFDPYVTNYKKDDVVQLHTYRTFFNTVSCRDINDNLYVVTSYYVENFGNGFVPINNPVYATAWVRGAVIRTEGNITAEIITASERNLINGTTPSNYFVHAYYRSNEVYDSLPYELCTNVDYPTFAIRPVPPPGVVLNKINFGNDTLLASSIYEYDYCIAATGDRLLATQITYPILASERQVLLQQLRVQRMSADSFAFVRVTGDKKGVVIGKEASTGFGSTSISYDFPRIVADNAGNALFMIRDYYRYVRVSPIGDGATLLWGSMGKPIGAGVYKNSFLQPDYPDAFINPDGTGSIAWHDNRYLGTDGSNNIYTRRLDNLNSYTYTPPVKKLYALPYPFPTASYPEILLGTSHQFTAFNTYNSGTGTVSPVVEISDDYNLGAVTVSTYQHNGASRLFGGKPYLHRNYKIAVEHNPAGAANIHVRLYFTQQDLDAMKASDPSIINPGDLQVIKQEDNSSGYAPNTYTPVTGEETVPITAWGAVDGGYYIEIVVTGFSNFFVFKGTGALPVTWVNVQAQWLNDKEANISWQVAQQQQVKEYIVQSSTDGVHYINGCTVAARNTNQYSCIMPAGNDNKYYYRILQTDLDGRSSMSKVVTLQSKATGNVLLISPNPSVNGTVSLNYNVNNEKITGLVLINSNGAVVWKRTVTLSGSGSFILPVQTLPAGIYGVRIQQNSGWQTLKLMKQ
jgi:hypothetical protein